MSIDDIAFCVGHYQAQYGFLPRMITTGPRVRRALLSHLIETDANSLNNELLTFRGMTVQFDPRLHGIRLS
jgi:hypothetical protein